MRSKFDQLKRLFSRESRPVPPELDWEKMEDGILQKMDELQGGTSASKRTGRGPIFRIFGVILLLLLIPAFCVQVFRDQAAKEVVAENEISKRNTGDSSGNAQVTPQMDPVSGAVDTKVLTQPDLYKQEEEVPVVIDHKQPGPSGWVNCVECRRGLCS